MQLSKIVIQALEKLVSQEGITYVAEGAGVNYRTIRSVIENGTCKKEQHEKITDYVLLRTEEKKKRDQKMAERLR
jgi:hypothetical protein